MGIVSETLTGRKYIVVNRATRVCTSSGMKRSRPHTLLTLPEQEIHDHHLLIISATINTITYQHNNHPPVTSYHLPEVVTYQVKPLRQPQPLRPKLTSPTFMFILICTM